MALPRAGRGYPRTVCEFRGFFRSERRAGEWLVKRRWSSGWVCECGETLYWWRVVTCPACGLGPLDRDHFSALKARLVGETGVTTLDDGALNTQDFRAQAIAHCATTKPAADVAVGEDGDRTRDARGVSCQTEPSSTSTGRPAQLAQAVSDLAARQDGRAHRRVSDKRDNTRTHTDRPHRRACAHASGSDTKPTRANQPAQPIGVLILKCGG